MRHAQAFKKIYIGWVANSIDLNNAVFPSTLVSIARLLTHLEN